MLRFLSGPTVAIFAASDENKLKKSPSRGEAETLIAFLMHFHYVKSSRNDTADRRHSYKNLEAL